MEERSFVPCEELKFGRISFKGFNPEVEVGSSPLPRPSSSLSSLKTARCLQGLQDILVSMFLSETLFIPETDAADEPKGGRGGGRAGEPDARGRHR